MNILKYKGYMGKVEYSHEDEILHGVVEGINDFVDFASENASEIEEEFHKAVDGYIEFCKEVGKEPEKPYCGSFNIRMEPELHRAISRQAMAEGRTLNQFMVAAARRELAYSKSADAMPPRA